MHACKTGMLAGLVALVTAACGDSTTGKHDLVIFQTNDRHSSFLGHSNYDYLHDRSAAGTEGGVARMATVLAEARAGAKAGGYEVLLFSAGDFTMGTMMRAAGDCAGDLNFLDDMGYDAAALGNHEFDWGAATVPDMIASAGAPQTPLLCANIEFSDGPEDDALEALYGEPGVPGKVIRPWVVVETPGGRRVGAIGIMGKAAEASILPEDVSFTTGHDDLAALIQPMVDHLRGEEQVDLVVALAHMGLDMDNGTPRHDSVKLAKRVEGIDMIFSGHVHKEVGPVEIACEKDGSGWTTIIMQAGAHGKLLGRWDVTFDKQDQPEIEAGIIHLDSSIAADPEWVAREQELVADVEANYLSRFPDDFLKGDYLQVLATSDFGVLTHDNQNNNLLYLVTDAMRSACGCEIAVASGGHDIRKSMHSSTDGSLALGDVFNVSPMGGGLDPLLGNPVIVVYISRIQLLYGLDQTNCGDGRTDNDYMMGLSGAVVTCKDDNSNENDICGDGGLVSMEVYEGLDETVPGTMVFDDGWAEGVDQQGLVSVCMSLDIARKLTSFGIEAKHDNGEKMTDLTEGICRDAGGGEVKVWYAVASYLDSFGGTVPARYDDDEQNNPVGPSDRRAPCVP